MNSVLNNLMPYIEIGVIIFTSIGAYYSIHFRLKKLEENRVDDKTEFLRLEKKLEIKIDRIEKQLIDIQISLNRLFNKK